MLLPILALYAYVRIVPIGWSFMLSLYDWKLISRIRRVRGIAELRCELFADSNFQ